MQDFSNFMKHFAPNSASNTTFVSRITNLSDSMKLFPRFVSRNPFFPSCRYNGNDISTFTCFVKHKQKTLTDETAKHDRSANHRSAHHHSADQHSTDQHSADHRRFLIFSANPQKQGQRSQFSIDFTLSGTNRN